MLLFRLALKPALNLQIRNSNGQYSNINFLTFITFNWIVLGGREEKISEILKNISERLFRDSNGWEIFSLCWDLILRLLIEMNGKGYLQSSSKLIIVIFLFWSSYVALPMFCF